jgi:hypothetical protein
MSSNRLMYDTCEYKQRLQESVTSIDFLLDPIKYEHKSRCRMELGILGGTNVSHIKGNLVDLENDLRGQNRPVTNCAEYKFIPSNNNFLQGSEYIKPVIHPKVDTEMQHLPSCQMIDYKQIPRPLAKNK